MYPAHLMFSCLLSWKTCSDVGWVTLVFSAVSTREMTKGFLYLYREGCRYEQGKSSRHGMRSLVWHCLLFNIPFCAACGSGSDNSWQAVLSREIISSWVPFHQKITSLWWKGLKKLGGDRKFSRIIGSEDYGKRYERLSVGGLKIKQLVCLKKG